MIARIQEAPIEINELLLPSMPGKTGGMVTFHGIVRGSGNSGTLRGLHYEAYEEMANTELSKIAGDVLQEFDLFDVRIVHRIGDVAVGETSLFVAVESEHRERAFSGCTAIVDRIKQMVPIWKKDLYEEGKEKWHD